MRRQLLEEVAVLAAALELLFRRAVVVEVWAAVVVVAPVEVMELAVAQIDQQTVVAVALTAEEQQRGLELPLQHAVLAVVALVVAVPAVLVAVAVVDLLAVAVVLTRVLVTRQLEEAEAPAYLEAV